MKNGSAVSRTSGTGRWQRGQAMSWQGRLRASRAWPIALNRLGRKRSISSGPEARVAAQVFVGGDEEHVLRGELVPAVGAGRLGQERAGVDRRHGWSFRAVPNCVAWGLPCL